MKNCLYTRRLVLLLSIVLIIMVGLPMHGPAAAYGEFDDSAGARSLIIPGSFCTTGRQDQSPSTSENSSPASSALCRLYTTTLSTARSLFSNGDGSPYLPWAPALIGLILVSFFVLAGWCAWKMRGHRPRRKYNIGRTI